MSNRLLMFIVAALCVSVAIGDDESFAWDGSQWPEPIQQAFAEAVVWNSVTWDSNDEAEARAEKNTADALDRAFTLAKAESPRVYASVLVAAAEGTFGASSYRTQLLDAVTDMLKSGRTARTLEQVEPALSGPGRREALEIIKAMRRDAEKAEAAATDAAASTVQVLLGGLSDEDIQWCIEAVSADPTFVPAWAALAINGDLEVQRYAVKQWARLEPDNGAPHIWFAELERRSREFVEQPVGLEHLELAIEKPTLSEPRFRMPTKFDVSYPDSERYRTADIVGRRVSSAALERLETGVNLSGTVTRALRNMYCVYIDEELKERVGRVVQQSEQDRAAVAIAILSARVCDRAGHDFIDFMRSSVEVVSSVGFPLRTDDETRTDLTHAERRLVQARRMAIDRIRDALNRTKELAGSSAKESDYVRLTALDKLQELASERDTLAAIRSEVNFEELVRAILAERGMLPE